MDELIGELEQITLQLVCEIDSSTYEQMSEFIKIRERIINNLHKHPITAADKLRFNDTIKQILQYDSVISARMSKLKLEASVELDKINVGRRQKNGYIQDFTSDAVFFDKKK